VHDGMYPARVGSSAKSNLLGLVRRHRLDLVAQARPQVLDGHVVRNQGRGTAARRLIVEAHDAVRRSDARRQPHEETVQDVAHDQGGSHAKSQQRDGRQRGVPVAQQAARREPNVLYQRIHGREAQLRAIGFTDGQHRAERSSGGCLRVFVRQPSPAVFVREQLQVQLHLLRQAVLAPVKPEHARDAYGEHSKAGHRSPPSRRFTIATVRAQLPASAASCFRPAAVIR